MAAAFLRTTRALKAHRSRLLPILVVVLTLVLAGWAAWLAMGSVALYEVATEARVEARQAVHPVAPAVGGRVVALTAAVGQTVQAGDVLVELDSESQRLALEEGRARLRDLEGQAAALETQIAAEQEALTAEGDVTDVAADEARAWSREAQARADRAEEEVDTLGSLHDRDLASRDQVSQAEADLAAYQAEVSARRLEVRRHEEEGAVRVRDRQTRIAELQREQTALSGQADVDNAHIQSLELEIAQRRVQAPVAGQIGEMSDIRVGSMVAAGQVLARIVPAGEVHVVAFFPTTAAGRLRNGQAARLRFPGYSWTQYGTLPARVVTVGQEPVDGQLRVELEIGELAGSAIPLEHSLPTIAEVEVERVSPLELVLRAAGKVVQGD